MSPMVVRPVAHRLMALALALCAVYALVLGALPAAPAHAYPRVAHDTTGYSISLSASATEVAYGSGISLKAVMTFPASNPPSTTGLYAIFFGGTQVGGDLSASTATSVTFNGTVGSYQAPGQYDAVATYTDPTTNAKVTSNTLSITVDKALTQLTCFDGAPVAVSPGQLLTIQMELGGGSASPVDWSSATASINFVGSVTFTNPGLHPDNNGSVSVPVPTQIGFYQLQCDFNGSNTYGPASFNLQLLVSQQHALGTVQLYSQSTPPPPGTTTPYSLEVVFHAAPGLPTPSGGSVSLYFNSTQYGLTQCSTSQTLPSDGVLLVTVYPRQGLTADGITVYYSGDPYYAPTSTKFPLTNPPIPGSGGSGGGGGGATSAKPTPAATAQATATATVPSSSLASGASSTVAPTAQPTPAPGIFGVLAWGASLNGWLWLVALLVLLSGGVGVGTFLWLSRRSYALAGSLSPDAPPAAASPPTMERAPGDAPTTPMRASTADAAPTSGDDGAGGAPEA